MLKNKKISILIAHFGRLEKLLLFHLLQNNDDFEIVGIITDHKPEEVVYFLEYDSNHGKFLPAKISAQNTQNKRGVTFHLDKKIFVDVFDSSTPTFTKLKKMSIDLIVDLSSSVKFGQLSKYSKIVKKKVLAVYNPDLKKSQGCQVGVFHFNHNKFDLNNKIILLPPIEATTIAILLHSLKKKLIIDSCLFDLVCGPNNELSILDTLPCEKQFFLNRSVFNNLITYPATKISNVINQLLNSENINIPVKGQLIHAPVTTGALLNLKLHVKKLFKTHEINDLLSQEADAQIGFANKVLVSQDIVSTAHYGVIDESLTQILETTNYQVINLGIWFDSESSMSISCFRTLQFLAGMKKNG